MNIHALLPIGSVVSLSASDKKVMIIGFAQQEVESDYVWDYAGVLYPVGYLGEGEVYLFNQSQISNVYMLGYQDADQLAFLKNAEQLLSEIHGQNET